MTLDKRSHFSTSFPSALRGTMGSDLREELQKACDINFKEYVHNFSRVWESELKVQLKRAIPMAFTGKWFFACDVTVVRTFGRKTDMVL